MFANETGKLVEASVKKTEYLNRSPLGYVLLSALAGIYVGFGIILIFSVGGPIQASAFAPLLKVIMGASFGVALSLVIFAGSELFTGNNMVFSVAGLYKKAGLGFILRLFFLCYLGNFLGSIFLAWLMIQGGSFTGASSELILNVASSKMSAGAWPLFVRGILCNWLVCLAVWVCGRTGNDMAKLALIFWCLYAFIASGFEHCVANMTLLGLAMFLPHGADISIIGFGHNLLWVSLGNLAGGGLFVGAAYWFASAESEGKPSQLEPAPAVREEAA